MAARYFLISDIKLCLSVSFIILICREFRHHLPVSRTAEHHAGLSQISPISSPQGCRGRGNCPFISIFSRRFKSVRCDSCSLYTDADLSAIIFCEVNAGLFKSFLYIENG